MSGVGLCVRRTGKRPLPFTKREGMGVVEE
jgi:hypothetical protein